MLCVHVLLSVLLFNISLVKCARILAVFPTPSLSHQITFRPLTQELAKRGHELTVITPDPAFTGGVNVENLKEIDVHHSYGLKKNLFKYTSGNDTNLRSQVEVLFYAFTTTFVEQLQNQAVATLINNETEKYDLLLLEACSRTSLALTYIYKVPTIQISSFGPLKWNSELFGTPTHPSFYPTIFHQKLHNLTIWEKFIELHNHYQVERIIDKYQPLENRLMKRYFGDDLPPLQELRDNIDMLFLNVHPMWESRRPVPANVVYLGNMHLVNEKKLPEDLKSHMDSCDNGIIYVSFGTNVKCSILPNEFINKLINVFSKLPYNILWKCDVKEFRGQTKNINISKWFPQSDLLKHPNVKLFITQGGLQSTDEAIAAGVPLIGIPWLADQWYNVEHYVYYKIGIRLDKETMTEENLMNAILSIINDNAYRRNMAQLRSIMYDQPQRPLERAVWWIEHMLRHGAAQHLRAPATNLSWAEYFELELLTILFICSFTGIIIIITIIKYICRNIPKVLTRLHNSYYWCMQEFKK